jgi:hypothetical protein
MTSYAFLTATENELLQSSFIGLTEDEKLTRKFAMAKVETRDKKKAFFNKNAQKLAKIMKHVEKHETSQYGSEEKYRVNKTAGKQLFALGYVTKGLELLNAAIQYRLATRDKYDACILSDMVEYNTYHERMVRIMNGRKSVKKSA